MGNGFEFLYQTSGEERQDAIRFGLQYPERFVPGEWTPVGVLTGVGSVKIAVAVMALPARFYRFTVISEGVTVVETGSGRFPQAWDGLIGYLNGGQLPEGWEVA